ncbi:unnamed protein product [Aphanomyces euteiches]|nr:hypothetical protein AeRB84_003103 [Aphanomyces euteiches]
MSEEEADCCPLCMEELDLTDKTFDACRCGYQVCLWCWHQIKNEYNGLCPACRAPYSELAKSKGNVDREDVVRRTKQRKQKEKIEKKSTAPPKAAPINRKSLVNVRVMQRNLVYVIGLPVHYADEELLRSKECFGQYGRIVKAVVNKSHLNTDRNNATASAYITFAHKPDAQNCIDLIDGYVLDGSLLRASFGTTKYCNFFLRNLSCNNPECLYLHELGETDDSFTKEEMQTAGKGCFRDISPYEERRGSRFPPLTASMMRESATEAKPQLPRGSAVSSDAQRKAQSAAAIYKLKQHTERDDDRKQPPPRPRPDINPTSASPLSSASTQASSTAASPAKDPSKPVLYVDTGHRAAGDHPPLRTDEPLWNQPFPKSQTASSEEPQRPIAHVFSPFGMGFDGGIGRVQESSLRSPPPPAHDVPSVQASTTHTSAWSFEPLERQPTPPSVASSGFEFASVDAAFTPRNESSEALAGLLGVQLSAKPLIGSSMLSSGSNSKRGSRFSFANKTETPPHPPMEDYNPFGGLYRAASPEKLFDEPAPGFGHLSMPPPPPPSSSDLSGLAFLQQMLPNVKISYGREPTEQHLQRPAYTQSFDQKSSWSNGDSRQDLAADPFWSRPTFDLSSGAGAANSVGSGSGSNGYSFQDPAIVTQGAAYGSSSFYQDETKPFGRPPYASPQHNMSRS